MERGSLRRASWNVLGEGSGKHSQMSQREPGFLACCQLTGTQVPTSYPALPIPFVFYGLSFSET